MRRIAVAVLLVTGGLFGQQAGQVKFVTVCDVLHARSSFNGQYVALVGRVTSTDEGIWFGAECGDQIKTGSYIWSNIISLKYDPAAATALADDFDLEKAASSKAVAEIRARLKTSKKSTEWGIVFGRIETQEELQIGASLDGTLRPAGFGHLGGAPAQIVYRRKDLKNFSLK